MACLCDCECECECEREMKEGFGNGGDKEYERDIARGKSGCGEDIYG